VRSFVGGGLRDILSPTLEKNFFSLSPPMDASAVQTAVARLEELRALNIITEREYANRRAEIIDRALLATSSKGAKGGKGRDGGWGKGVGGYVRGGGAYWQPDWPAHTPGWPVGAKGSYSPSMGAADNPQSRVLLATFKDAPFPGHDAVAAHFATTASVEKITHVSKPDREQALVQVATVEEAVNCVRVLNHSSASWCPDIDVQRARVPELTFKTNDAKNKSYVALSPGRVLLLTLEGLQGPFPGLDALHTMFKIYGTVERMSHVSKPDREQCMIQFADPAAAASALTGLQGWNMGFCVFSIQVARTDALTFRQEDDRNKEFTGVATSTATTPTPP